MKEIVLTQGQKAIIDDCDYDLVKVYAWQAAYKSSTNSFYAITTFMDSQGVQHTIRMHRLIANTPKGQPTDHKNRNTLDNRRQNLRICTPSQNNCNRKTHSNNASGFKGVSFRRARGKFQAAITLNGKKKYLGLFATAQEASIAYNETAKRLHGEFYCAA